MAEVLAGAQTEVAVPGALPWHSQKRRTLMGSAAGHKGYGLVPHSIERRHQWYPGGAAGKLEVFVSIPSHAAIIVAVTPEYRRHVKDQFNRSGQPGVWRVRCSPGRHSALGDTDVGSGGCAGGLAQMGILVLVYCLALKGVCCVASSLSILTSP